MPSADAVRDSLSVVLLFVSRFTDEEARQGGARQLNQLINRTWTSASLNARTLALLSSLLDRFQGPQESVGGAEKGSQSLFVLHPGP